MSRARQGRRGHQEHGRRQDHGTLQGEDIHIHGVVVAVTEAEIAVNRPVIAAKTIQAYQEIGAWTSEQAARYRRVAALARRRKPRPRAGPSCTLALVSLLPGGAGPSEQPAVAILADNGPGF
ncbi:MAG: hypothetical protein U1F43_33955 [Myxococcota bacterium]